MEKVNYIYGPIKSRRLGLSLGIDLTPGKICSFDCIYCQAGRTKVKTTERRVYADPEVVLGQLRVWLQEHADIAQGLKYVTIAGSGEPTLHSGLVRDYFRDKKDNSFTGSGDHKFFAFGLSNASAGITAGGPCCAFFRRGNAGYSSKRSTVRQPE